MNNGKKMAKSNSAEMKILIRLPNWLGDVVMSLGFINALREHYPDAQLDVICKKGLEELVAFMPGIHKTYVFSKAEYKGVLGLRKFGRQIQQHTAYDLFFCLPNSFSSALMGYFTGAKKRIGYKQDGRSWLLTHTYKVPIGKHRVDEYLQLLQCYLPQSNRKAAHVFFDLTKTHVNDRFLINFNSEAQSRRMPIAKAVKLVNAICAAYTTPLFLLGSPKDAAYITAIEKLCNQKQVINLAGATRLGELVTWMNESRLLISVDSGPSHLANALKTPVVVMHGADDENNTEAYNKAYVFGFRNGKLPCEPCVRNTCTKFPEPECLLQLDESILIQKIKTALAATA